MRLYCFILLCCFAHISFADTINKNNNTISGDINIIKDRWNLISSPIRGEVEVSYLLKYTSRTIWGFDDNSYYSANKIERGKGYWLYADLDGGVARVEGVKNINTKDTPMLLREILEKDRWNLVGTDLDAKLNDVRLLVGVDRVYAFNSKENGYLEDGNISAGSGMWIYGESRYKTQNWYDDELSTNDENILPY